MKHLLFLIPDTACPGICPEEGGQHLIARYAGKAKFLLNYIDMLEKVLQFRFRGYLRC